MAIYKLDYISGGFHTGYQLLKYESDDTKIGVSTIGVIYDPHIAKSIVDHLNAENDNKKS